MSREPAATIVPVKKLLLVDDDAAVREAWSNYLAWHGYEVVEAADGLEALLAVKHERLAAVVLDLALPRLGGLDALKRIHRFDPSLPVVVVTGMPDPEVHRQAIALGALAVLTKPVASSELLIALGGAKQSPEGPTERSARSPSEGRPAPGETHGPGRVLVVDDDADVRAMLEDLLNGTGWQVRSVADGGAAVREIVQTPPDVVLLDNEMPKLRGIEALKTIRAVAPEVTVIMVSGTMDAESATRALALGAFDYIAKPIDPIYLAQSVRMALMMKQVERG